MDKNENGNEKGKQGITQKPLGILKMPIATEYVEAVTELLNQIDKSNANDHSLLKMHEKSILVDKKMIAHVSFLSGLVHEVTKYAIVNAYTVDFLRQRTEILERIVRRLSEKTKDIPTKEELKKLEKVSTQLEHIDAVMSAIQPHTQGKAKTKKATNGGVPHIS